MVDDPAFLPLVLIDLLGLAGIIVWHLQGRRRPRARLIVQILFFAAMTALVAVNGIWPHQLGANETTGLAAFVAKSARVLWWTHLAWAVIGVRNEAPSIAITASRSASLIGSTSNACCSLLTAMSAGFPYDAKRPAFPPHANTAVGPP